MTDAGRLPSRRPATVLCAAALALAGPAVAQTGSPIDRDRADRAQPGAAAPIVRDTPAAATRVEAGDEAAPPIRNIRFEGTDVPLVVAEAAQPFVGRPATRINLQAMTAAMSQAYGRSEVALFTIVIPEQDLSEGNVRVLVAEGHLETVVLTGEVEGRPLRLVRAYADRLTRQRPTRRATLERYLSLIRDIPGLGVTASLETGQGAGGVRMILALDYRRPTVSLSFDNRTTRLVRDGQFQGRARGYGLIREGDETELGATASVDFNDLLYVGLTHSTPLGTEGTRFGFSAGLLETRPPGGMRGEARAVSLTLSHPLIRSYRQNLTLGLSFDGLNSDNAAFGSLVSSERTRAVRASATWSHSRRRRAASAAIVTSRGLDILGARVPPEIGQPDFTKINARGAVDQAVGRRGAVRLRGGMQYTRDRLPAAERFSIGGLDYGRAFETGLINADRGYGVSAEFAWRPIPNGRFAPSELYVFADRAEVRILSRGATPGQDFDMASAGGGVRLGWTDKAMIELEAAHTIDRPYPGYASDWRISIGWRLSLRP